MLSQITDTVTHKFSQFKVILYRLKWLALSGEAELCLIFLLKIKLLQLGENAKIAGKCVIILINSIFNNISDVSERQSSRTKWMKEHYLQQQMWSHFCLKCDHFRRRHAISDSIYSLLTCHYFKLSSPCCGFGAHWFHFPCVQKKKLN